MSMRRPGATMKSAEKSVGLRIALLVGAIIALVAGASWFFSQFGAKFFHTESGGGSPLKDMKTIQGK